MKVAIILLTYGNRPKDIQEMNLSKAGYLNTCTFEVNREGIANALNDGIDLMIENNCDAVAFLSNDIIEPQDWLIKKVEALRTYPDAGVVASSIHEPQTAIKSELIISNWLLARSTVEKIGYFNESMFPYGPIDLDYCERCFYAGLKTYYVINCHSVHNGDHATGDEYGWDKGALVGKYMPLIGNYNDSNFYKARHIVNEI